MCCFKPSPQWVARTRIFGRMTTSVRQMIAYTMEIGADTELAMILPIPVALKAADDAVRFIGLEGYPSFFADLAGGFPVAGAITYGKAGGFGGVESAPMLPVVAVGKYEASFVPTINDFDRLDDRFRIDREVWLTRPEYADYGFVVFKLKPATAPAPPEATAAIGNARPTFAAQGKESQSFHPMVFEFPVRRIGQPLFFPTLHIHDGELHAKEHFDHELYCQPMNPRHSSLRRWTESQLPIEDFVDAKRAAALIKPGEHCFRQIIHGRRENRDIWV